MQVTDDRATYTLFEDDTAPETTPIKLTGDPATDLKLIQAKQDEYVAEKRQVERRNQVASVAADVLKDYDYTGFFGDNTKQWLKVTERFATDLAQLEVDGWANILPEDLTTAEWKAQVASLVEAYMKDYSEADNYGHHNDISDDTLAKITDGEGDLKHLSSVSRYQVEWFWEKSELSFTKPGTLASGTKLEQRGNGVYAEGTGVRLDFSPMYSRLSDKKTTRDQVSGFFYCRCWIVLTWLDYMSGRWIF